MKSKIIASFGGMLSLALVLTTPVTSPAQSQNDASLPAVSYRLEDFEGKPISEVLDLTYRILGEGNRNYNGHRLRAVKAIEAAAGVLGVPLPERGRGGKEEQSKSDARITLCQRLLDQLRPRLTEQEQSEALGHIDKALRELSTALKIRAIEEEAAREDAAIE